MSQPKTFLLQLLVGVNPPNNILSYLDPTLTQVDPLHVNVGDEVGFLVQFVLPNGRQQPACSISFADSTFFGQPSVDVPANHTSQFLRVLSVVGKVKYTLNVPGLGAVLDPEIQSGGGGPFIIEKAPSLFALTWDVGNQTATYTQDGNPVPPTTPVTPLVDSVEFVVTNTGGPPQNFTASFSINKTHWASPFDLNQQSFPANPANSPVIGPDQVLDTVDGGKQFPFTASVSLNGQPVSLPPGINPYITLAAG
jgi:hypothetical protein